MDKNRKLLSLHAAKRPWRDTHAVKILFSATLLFSLLAALLLLVSPHPLQILYLKSTDLILNAGSPQPASDQVVLVKIDNDSLSRNGQWPWPRYRLAMLLEKIQQQNADSIGLNIIFPEPDRTSPLQLQEQFRKDFGYSLNIAGIPQEHLDHDTILSQIINQGPVVLGYDFFFEQPPKTSDSPCTIHPVDLNATDQEQCAASHLPEAGGLLCNHAPLMEAVDTSGFLNVHMDKDGLLRRLPLLIRYKGQHYPSFSLAVLMKYHQQRSLPLNVKKQGRNSLRLAGHEIIFDDNGNFLLGPISNTSEVAVSAADVLDGNIPPTIFKDKIVLIGLTSSGLSRTIITPFGEIPSQLHLQKVAIESLSANHISHRSNVFPLLEALLAMLLCMLLFIGACFLSKGLTTFIFLCLISSVWVGAIWLHQYSGHLFSPLYPSLALVVHYCLLIILKYRISQTQAQQQAMVAFEQLQTSEANMQSIMNAIPDIVFRVDKMARITYISRAINRYGTRPESLLGCSIFKLVDDEDKDKAQYHLNERRTGLRATRNYELRMQLPDAELSNDESPLHFLVSAQGIYQVTNGGEKRYLGTQGIIRDITEIKNLENHLMRAQKMEAVGNLAAGIAHDLNNILSGIVSYPDLLLLEIPRENPLHNKISVIQKSGKKAAAIVQDLLTLARRNVLVQEECDLNSIISDYLDSVDFAGIRKRHPHITMISNLYPLLSGMTGSPVHLSKVIMNIIINALEAMPEGGELKIATANNEITVPLSLYEEIPVGQYVVLTISDTGMGIDRSDLKRIFEPFYTKKSMHLSGTGLGMTIIWATIKDHKGFVDISSRPGMGTTFTVFLPATGVLQNNAPVETALDDYVGSENILIVDDLPEQLEIAKSMLQQLGYNCWTAEGGQQAVTLLQRQPADLVIMDMIMPGGMDGLETYQEIIRLRPGQKAIVTSGFSESARVKQMQQLGAGTYVQKPYTLEALAIAIRRELDTDNPVKSLAPA